MASNCNVDAKGRQKTAPFVGIPKAVLATDKYAQLSGWDVKLLLDLVSQYNGRNNGDLCVAWGTTPKFKGMKDRGWRSKGTLYRSLRQLQDCGFIEQTRQGGKHRASLYAVTWQPIDERLDPITKKHKLDAKPTFVAAGTWKDRPEN